MVVGSLAEAIQGNAEVVQVITGVNMLGKSQCVVVRSNEAIRGYAEVVQVTTGVNTLGKSQCVVFRSLAEVI